LRLSSSLPIGAADADAERFDRNYNEYLSLVPRLQRSAQGTDPLVNEISFTALRHRWPEIAVSTAGDVVRYTVPMLAYPLDLAVWAMPVPWWTHSRMSMAHPNYPPALPPTPPARSIPSTTWSATRASAPPPCMVPPRSLTTTDAPRRASSIA
jgi:hypothetical protein